MRSRSFLVLFVLLATTRLGGQTQDCPLTAAEQRRVAEEVVQTPAVRRFIREGRTRVIHVYCAERDKESRRNALIVVVYNYSANFAVRLVADPGSREVIAGERLTGQPETSAEEREEAFRLVREKLDITSANVVLEGGFLVDPPANAPREGRYVEVQVLSPDRWKLLELVTVELSKGVIAARRRL